MAIKWKNVKEKFRKYEAGKVNRQRLQRPNYFDIIETFLEGRAQDHVVECGLEDIITQSQDMSPSQQSEEKALEKMLQQTIEEMTKGKKRASCKRQQQEQMTTESHGQEQEEDEDENEDEDGDDSAAYPLPLPPSPKRTRRLRHNGEVGNTLKMILEENQRHNAAVELHNAQMRLLFAKMVNSMEAKNKILKDVVEKEDAMET